MYDYLLGQRKICCQHYVCGNCKPREQHESLCLLFM